MRFSGDTPSTRVQGELEIRIAGPEDVASFALVHGGRETWARKLSRATTVEAMQDARSTFYLGIVSGQPVATLHLLCDGATAGIYAVATLRAFRRRGIASAMIARAVADARAAGCDLICLSTDAGGAAERLYERLGFERAFESTLWVEPERPFVPVTPIRKRRRRKAK
jgi:ribosomal protein S18 acetylase RimI-like enzyme